MDASETIGLRGRTMKGNVFLVEKNVHGAWVIYGRLGVKQYYGYSKKQAVERYNAECERTLFEVARQ